MRETCAYNTVSLMLGGTAAVKPHRKQAHALHVVYVCVRYLQDQQATRELRGRVQRALELLRKEQSGMSIVAASLRRSYGLTFSLNRHRNYTCAARLKSH